MRGIPRGRKKALAGWQCVCSVVFNLHCLAKCPWGSRAIAHSQCLHTWGGHRLQRGVPPHFHVSQTHRAFSCRMVSFSHDCPAPAAPMQLPTLCTRRAYQTGPNTETNWKGERNSLWKVKQYCQLAEKWTTFPQAGLGNPSALVKALQWAGCLACTASQCLLSQDPVSCSRCRWSLALLCTLEWDNPFQSFTNGPLTSICKRELFFPSVDFIHWSLILSVHLDQLWLLL